MDLANLKSYHLFMFGSVTVYKEVYMFKWYRDIQKLKDTRYQYELLQKHLTKLAKASTNAELYNARYNAWADNELAYGTKKKIDRLYFKMKV